MRLVRNNKTTVYYKTYTGKTQIVDSNGLNTGEYDATYSALASCDMSVSPAGGKSEYNIFGITTPYSRILYTDDMSCPINEKSILWIGIATTSAHNYVVTQVAKSKHWIAYGVEETRNE